MVGFCNQCWHQGSNYYHLQFIFVVLNLFESNGTKKKYMKNKNITTNAIGRESAFECRSHSLIYPDRLYPPYAIPFANDTCHFVHGVEKVLPEKKKALTLHMENKCRHVKTAQNPNNQINSIHTYALCMCWVFAFDGFHE